MSKFDKPSDEIFEELKEKAIELWNTYDNTYGYVDEKVNRIKNVENYGIDDIIYIVNMFDWNNQKKLSNSLSIEANKFIVKLYK